MRLDLHVKWIERADADVALPVLELVNGGPEEVLLN